MADPNFDEIASRYGGKTASGEAADALASKYGGAAAVAPKPERLRNQEFAETGQFTPSGEKAISYVPDLPQWYQNFLTGMSSSYRGIGNLASKAYDTVRSRRLSDVVAPEQEGAGDVLWPKARGSAGSGMKVVGSLMDPVSLAAGAGIGKLLPYVPVLTKLTGQLTAQGIPIAAATTMAEKAIATAKNLAGGGVAGGAISTISDEGDAATGTQAGAALNVVLPPAISGVAKGVGKVIDVVKGATSANAAGKVLREVAGDDLPAIQAALEASKKADEAAVAAGRPALGLTASQAAAGVNNDVWAAAGEAAAKADKTSFYARKAEQQLQDIAEPLRRNAGAANQTEARKVAEASQDALNSITTPMREAELAAANTAGKVGTRLQGEADALGEAASANVEDVRRLARAGETAERVGAEQPRLGGGAPPVPGLPRTGSQYSYGTELAALAERLAGTRAQQSLTLGEARRFKQMQVDSLAEHGLKPLESGSIIAKIDSMLKDPRIGSETMKERVLTEVRKRLEKWTDSNGVIDAAALYGIRKSAVNDAIEQLMGSAEPKAKQKAASEILMRVKPLIDNAIESAGGTGWKNYLKTFEAGMTGINQQKMSAKALQMLEENPKKLEALAAGNRPRDVEKVFGSEYDLDKAMGAKAIPIRAAAEVVKRERRLDEAAGRGKQALDEILKKNKLGFTIPNQLDVQVSVTNRVLRMIEEKLNKDTAAKVMSGMRSGQDALKILSSVPSAERMEVLKILTSAQLQRAAVSQSVAAMPKKEEPNESIVNRRRLSQQ